MKKMSTDLEKAKDLNTRLCSVSWSDEYFHLSASCNRNETLAEIKKFLV